MAKPIHHVILRNEYLREAEPIVKVYCTMMRLEETNTEYAVMKCSSVSTADIHYLEVTAIMADKRERTLRIPHQFVLMISHPDDTRIPPGFHQ